MSKNDRARQALTRLILTYERKWNPSYRDPFKTLIRTVLSQNTSWQNEETAYNRLEKMIGISPHKLSEANVNQITEAIKPAGMYNQRGKVIKGIAANVMKNHSGCLNKVVNLPFEEAREALLKFPGVGWKTADVTLLFSAGKGVLPIDRHIDRISKRLQLARKEADYEEVRHVLEATINESEYLDAHIILIQFGRDTCKARNPKCDMCILNDICPYPNYSQESKCPLKNRLKSDQKRGNKLFKA